MKGEAAASLDNWQSLHQGPFAVLCSERVPGRNSFLLYSPSLPAIWVASVCWCYSHLFVSPSACQPCAVPRVCALPAPSLSSHCARAGVLDNPLLPSPGFSSPLLESPTRGKPYRLLSVSAPWTHPPLLLSNAVLTQNSHPFLLIRRHSNITSLPTLNSRLVFFKTSFCRTS